MFSDKSDIGDCVIRRVGAFIVVVVMFPLDNLDHSEVSRVLRESVVSSVQHLRSSLCTIQALAFHRHPSMLSLSGLVGFRSMLAVEILFKSSLYLRI